MLAFGVLALAACIKLACCKCRDVNGVYVCADIPQSFPEGLKSILVFGTHVGELNSTAFASDALSSVTNLTLSNTATTAISPGALGKFQHLEVLDLSDNFLKKVTSIWFSHPDSLKNIIVSNNKIEHIDVTDLSDLFGLVSLDLSGNRIHAISQGSFDGLRSLQILDLSGNSLTYVNPEIFQPLDNTKIHLNGNPWACSCGKPGFEDFVIFLQELRSASRLENEVAVICNTPYPLEGAPVWNVSCPSPRPTITGVSVSTEAAVTDSMATTVTLSSHRPSSVNTQGSVAKLVIGLPALVCLIVVLCALVCIVCVLALLYHRKRKKKQIAPHATAQSGSNFHQTGFKQDKFPKAEAIVSNLLRGRAKSAGPVMCKSEILAKATTMLPKDAGEKGLHQSSEKNSPEGGTPAAVVTGNVSGNTEKQNSEFLQDTERKGGSAGNTEEDLPYLTIGFKPPTEHSEDHGYDSTGPLSPHIEKIQRHLVRVKTWPPTAIQWARQQAEQDETVDVSFFQKLQAELRLWKQEETPNVNLEPVCPPGGPEALAVDVPLGDTGNFGITEESPWLGCKGGPSSLDDQIQGFDGTLPDTGELRYHVTVGEPHQPIENTLRLEASTDRLEMDITTKKREEPEQSILRLETTRRTSDGNNDVRLEMRITTQKTEEDSAEEKSRTGTRQSKRRPRELESIRREGMRPRAHESTTAASALPKPSSPGDESLLRDNEYVFIDLLHEVVENHGRWTRERWRQSHLNRRKSQLK